VLRREFRMARQRSRASNICEVRRDAKRYSMTFIRVVIASGVLAFAWALGHSAVWHPNILAGFIFLACVAGAMRFRLPGVEGTFSLLFVLVLLSTVMLNACETLIVAMAGVSVQCFFGRSRRPGFQQIIFNVCAHATSALLAYVARAAGPMLGLQRNSVVLLPIVGTVFFLVNTGLVAGVVAATSGRYFFEVWRQWHLRCVPFYAAGSLLVAVVLLALKAGVAVPVLAATISPLFVLLYCSQRLTTHL
jgi:hypothetical protein